MDSVFGIELRKFSDNTYSCRYCLLEKAGNSIAIGAPAAFEGNLVEVINKIPRSCPIALALSGMGIVHKTISTEGDIKIEAAFPKVFPGANYADFFVQQVSGSTSTTLSIVRKQLVDDLLTKLSAAGIKVFSVCFGGAVVLQVLPQLNAYDREIDFDGHRILVDQDNTLMGYCFGDGLKSGFAIRLDGNELSEEYLLAYAAAFQLLLHDRIGPIAADVAIVDQNFKAFLENNQLRKKIAIVLSVLFVLLLVNFCLFSYYSDENEQLASTSSAKQNDIAKMVALSSQIAANEKLLKHLNWNSGYNYGFLVGEIGGSCPSSIALDAIVFDNYHAVKEQWQKFSVINVRGTTASLAALNNWIFTLKTKPWLKDLRLQRYRQTETNGKYEFNFIIGYG